MNAYPSAAYPAVTCPQSGIPGAQSAPHNLLRPAALQAMCPINLRNRFGREEVQQSAAPGAAIADKPAVGAADIGRHILNPGSRLHELEQFGKDALVAQREVMENHGDIGPAIRQRLRCLAVMDGPAVDEFRGIMLSRLMIQAAQ